jgi:hypothetical protein
VAVTYPEVNTLGPIACQISASPRDLLARWTNVQCSPAPLTVMKLSTGV